MLESFFSDCSANIIQYIKESSLVNLQEIENIIKMHFSYGFIDALRREDSSITEHLFDLLKEQASTKTDRFRRKKLQAEIQNVSQQRKTIRRAISDAEEHQEYMKFKKYIADHYGADVFTKFLNEHPELHHSKTSRING